MIVDMQILMTETIFHERKTANKTVIMLDYILTFWFLQKWTKPHLLSI